jgi:hypothetical protein
VQNNKGIQRGYRLLELPSIRYLEVKAGAVQQAAQASLGNTHWPARM